jgi:hypothetical protein
VKNYTNDFSTPFLVAYSAGSVFALISLFICIFVEEKPFIYESIEEQIKRKEMAQGSLLIINGPILTDPASINE